MTITITEVYGIEWNVNKGVPAGDHALPEPPVDPNNANGVIEPVEFQWEDTIARLIGGPEQLVDFWVQGRVYLDTRTITTADPPAENAGEIISDVVVRTYPAYTLSEMTFGSSLTDDWVDSTNPAKPKQYEGPILYKNNEHTLDAPVAMAAAGYGQVGILSNSATFSGFVQSKTFLPELNTANGNATFYIALDTGMGYVWANNLPGALVPGGSPGWVNSGLAKDPGDIITAGLGSIDDLPEEAPNGTWQLVNNGVYGTMYEKTDDGWLNIGPLQGPGPLVVIPDSEEKSYVSGYIYSLVFDQSRFRYVPRMSGDTQSTYEGEVDILTTGWFPDSPHDPDRNIYPMDSVTRVKPDGRTSVTATYTCTMTTSLATSTCTIYQDVYQPTYNWGDLIQQLLDLTYFKHGIYH